MVFQLLLYRQYNITQCALIKPASVIKVYFTKATFSSQESYQHMTSHSGELSTQLGEQVVCFKK